jgi:hypothetical protein
MLTVAKLIYSAITSLDGYVADEDGKFDWAAPDEEVHTFVNDVERPVSSTYWTNAVSATAWFTSTTAPRRRGDGDAAWTSAGWSGGDERVRRVDLRLTLNADLLQDRDQRLAEAAKCILGLPYVDDPKAVRALPGDVGQQALDGPVPR